MDQAKIRQVGQIERGMTWLRPPILTPAAFKALIAERGWRMADLACRWAIRPEHLSRIAADAARDTQWDDSVRALPTLSAREQAAVTAARRQLVPNPPRSRQVKPSNLAAGATGPEHAPVVGVPLRPFSWEAEDDEDHPDEAGAPGGDGFRYHAYLPRGAELVVVREIEGFAREQAILLVIATRVGADAAGHAQEEYYCESASGAQRWFTPEQIDDGLVSNGKMRKLR